MYRHDWTRADIPLSDERLRVVHARLRDLNAAYDRQAENLKRFDRWLTKRFTGAEGLEAGPPQEEDEPEAEASLE
jgi:hypothetical protein